MFALWTWTGHIAGRAPSGIGARETLALAIPTGPHGVIEVAEVDCALVEPDEFVKLDVVPGASATGVTDAVDIPGNPGTVVEPGPSLLLWREVLAGDERISRLPIAAHAVPDAVGASVVAADRALRIVRETRSVEVELATTLRAELRPYQVRGVGWLRETTDAFGGAVLADEMGLGKTVQTIGFLLGRAGEGPQLVVCPTSLVGNWAHEITRFAPGLRPVIWRGGDAPAVTDIEGAVVITGYPTLRPHGHLLAEQHWATAIFDEAQALKNPRTQVSKAARALRASATVALTGTPVENHLEELWALLNLVTPRLFAHRTQFRRRFVRPIAEGSTTAAARLRDTIEPVLLARRKSEVAASLPAKIHSDLLCDLSAEQEKLYDRLLDRAIDDGFGVGARRRSLVLAALTALKQVCNHPGLVTGELDELSGRSGKLDLCADIVATNLDNGSPTLVFTQYRQTGELLVRHLSEQFGITAPFFHGGLDRAHRASIVTDFQAPDGPPVLVLSLRAAGTGLTLTRAADVIHFDRWWNPAVEAQASDRAHRIGQTRTVTITTLTSATTVEEHIAGMHDRKSALTDLSDTTGIAALARLDDEQLVQILRRKREN